MQKRHLDRYQYFKEQAYTTEKYVIPYLSDFGEIDSESRILEIGCGEGGNLKPFVEMGCEVVGVDISERKIDLAESYLGEDGNYTLFRRYLSDNIIRVRSFLCYYVTRYDIL